MSTSTPSPKASRKRKATETPQAKTVKGSFGYALDPKTPPHTLILGTQPGDVSLAANRYYDTHTNAMWHIVGDALGWRRGWLDGKGRAPPASIKRSVLHERAVESYDEALSLLNGRGYCVWDVLEASERAGSLDGDIKNECAADVRGLVRAHPSITKICLASGSSTAGFFKRHFKPWLQEEGVFCLSANRATQQVFGKIVPKAAVPPLTSAIELVVMESVSPAFVPRVSYGAEAADKRQSAYAEAGLPHLSARASAYAWKRQQWFDECFSRELSDAERAKRFGDRPGDFVGEDVD